VRLISSKPVVDRLIAPFAMYAPNDVSSNPPAGSSIASTSVSPRLTLRYFKEFPAKLGVSVRASNVSINVGIEAVISMSVALDVILTEASLDCRVLNSKSAPVFCKNTPINPPTLDAVVLPLAASISLSIAK